MILEGYCGSLIYDFKSVFFFVMGNLQGLFVLKKSGYFGLVGCNVLGW